VSQVLMNRFDRDDVLERRAAELAAVAYRVVLRTKTEGTWLDLELDLWRALSDTLKTSERNGPSADSR
jgi:hypothetical protein